MKIVKYINTPSVKQNHIGKIKYLLKLFFVSAYIYIPIGYLLIILHQLFKRKKQYRYEVSICLIFKNEASYLKEWIEYHLLIGVDHFYLYNNFSDDDYKNILEPYIKRGLVTLIQWPYKFAQVAAYEDCYKRVKNETHWLGFIDADEFINLLKYNNLKSFLQRYNSYPALFLYWRMFGTSGIVEEPNKYLVTELYTSSWPYLSNVGKTFINNDYGRFVIGLHQSKAMIGCFPLFPIDDKRLFKPYFINPLSSIFGYIPKVYINHYWSKSYVYYKYKDFEKGDADDSRNIEQRRRPGRFELHELKNSVRDYSIQRWLILLKIRMEN